MAVKQGMPLIAIVDDDDTVGRALRRLVSSYEIQARVFRSGVEFLGSLNTDPGFTPQCVILDVQMKDIDGFEVHRRLRARGVDLPVVFITGSPGDEVRQHALAAGAAAFLRKPPDAHSVITALRKAITVQYPI